MKLKIKWSIFGIIIFIKTTICYSETGCSPTISSKIQKFLTKLQLMKWIGNKNKKKLLKLFWKTFAISFTGLENYYAGKSSLGIKI